MSGDDDDNTYMGREGRGERRRGGGGDILRADINQTDIASKDTAADSSEAQRRRADPE